LTVVVVGAVLWWVLRREDGTPATATGALATPLIEEGGLRRADPAAPEVVLLSAESTPERVSYAPDGRRVDSLSLAHDHRSFRRLPVEEVAGLPMRRAGDARLLALRDAGGQFIGMYALTPAGASVALDLTDDGRVELLMQARPEGLIIGLEDSDAAYGHLGSLLRATGPMCRDPTPTPAPATEMVVICAGQHPPTTGLVASVGGLTLDPPADHEQTGSTVRFARYGHFAQPGPGTRRRWRLTLADGWRPPIPDIAPCPDTITLDRIITNMRDAGLTELSGLLERRGAGVEHLRLILRGAERIQEMAEVRLTLSGNVGEGIQGGGGADFPDPMSLDRMIELNRVDIAITRASIDLGAARRLRNEAADWIEKAAAALQEREKAVAIGYVDAAYHALAKAFWSGIITPQQNEYRRYLFGPQLGEDADRQMDWYRGCSHILANYSSRRESPPHEVNPGPDVATAIAQAIAGRAFGLWSMSIHGTRFQPICPPPGEPPRRVCIAGFRGSQIDPNEGYWLDIGFVAALRPNTVGSYRSLVLLAPPELQGWRVIDEEGGELAELAAAPERWLYCERRRDGPECPRPDAVAPLHPGHGAPRSGG
jgi:hypothetical protein